MTDKLLPCPFCATEVSLYPQASGAGAFWIVCDAFQGGCGCEGPWVTKPEEAAAAWNGRDFSPMSIAAAVVTEMVSQAPAESSREWQTIDSAPKNVKVLAAYQNELGNWRIVTACYHTQLEWSDEYGDHEEEFAPEAWYEENDSSEVIYQTSRTPTHWQPLPAPPVAVTSEGQADGR